MIRSKKVVQKAICDACGAALSTKYQEGPDGKPRAAHYGKLVNSFGYGSELDDPEDSLSNLDLCEECYKKCFRALNLPQCTCSVPSHLRVYLTAFWTDNDQPCGEKAEVRREIYHAPEWVCLFCDWKATGRGYSLPDHRCETLNKVRGESTSACKFCRGEDPKFRFVPTYAERHDRWIHHKLEGVENVDCAASDAWIGAMRPGTRVDPKWLARVKADEEALLALARKKRGEERSP